MDAYSFDTLRDGNPASARQRVVMDKDADLIRAIARLAYFYKADPAASARRAAKAPAGCGA
ncbi:MAG: hypothetical protein R3C08_02935 [Hyphomonas sp.]